MRACGAQRERGLKTVACAVRARSGLLGARAAAKLGMLVSYRTLGHVSPLSIFHDERSPDARRLRGYSPLPVCAVGPQTKWASPLELTKIL